jgi:hypothetical protein
MQRIDAEIKSVRRHPVLARDLVENRRRDRVINAARPDEQSVEFVLVLREKLQLRRDPFRNNRRQERVDRAAGRDERGERDGSVKKILTESFGGARRNSGRAPARDRSF